MELSVHVRVAAAPGRPLEAVARAFGLGILGGEERLERDGRVVVRQEPGRFAAAGLGLQRGEAWLEVEPVVALERITRARARSLGPPRHVRLELAIRAPELRQRRRGGPGLG